MPFKVIPPLYCVWASMRNRCNNPNIPQWKDYGGRGITVCKRWDSFATFVADMGPRPNGYLLDRINNDKGYSPSNCRWTTRSQQQLNQRRTRKITIEGREYIAQELAQKYGFKTDTLIERAAKIKTFAELVDRSHRGKPWLTVCKRGHRFTEENTYIFRKADGKLLRQCRQCHNMRARGEV